MSIGELLYVEWLDHCSLQGRTWYDIEDVNEMEPLRIKTVGWVVRETSEFVVLASQIAPGDKIAGEICIIKVCIIDHKSLKGPTIDIDGSSEGNFSPRGS